MQKVGVRIWQGSPAPSLEGAWNLAGSRGSSLDKVAQSLGGLGALLCHILPICKMGGLEN